MSEDQHHHLTIAKALLRDHEGWRDTPYKCTAGKLTICYGHNLEDNPLTPDVGEYILHSDVMECMGDLQTFPWWDDLSENRKAAMIDMRFCLGPNRFRKFKKMLVALDQKNYPWAAREVLDSLFASQTGRRAEKIASLLEDG